MERHLAKRQFTWRSVKRWRNIQTAALLPLILTGFFVFYFKEASPLGIMAFFLVLIVGVLLPQVRRDLVISHIVLSLELEEGLQKLEEETAKLLDERFEKTDVRKSVKESPISQSAA
jgi:hypothetical protein